MFDFTYSVENNILLINVEGDLLGEMPETKLLDLLDEYIAQNIILCAIDISKIGYMSSKGMSLLVRALTRLRNNGGEITLINPSQRVSKLLLITKLNAIFKIVKTKQQAFDLLIS